MGIMQLEKNENMVKPKNNIEIWESGNGNLVRIIINTNNYIDFDVDKWDFIFPYNIWNIKYLKEYIIK